MESEIENVHFTAFGVRLQPRCADWNGFLYYRDGFEALPRDQWTDAEEWIHAQYRRIAAWREMNP